MEFTVTEQAEARNTAVPSAGTPLPRPSDNGRFDALLERAGYGSFRVTATGKFAHVNSALTSLLGYETSDDLLALDIASDVWTQSAERLRTLEESPADGFSEWTVTRWRRRDGSDVGVRVAVQAILNESGEVEAWEGIVEDLSERQRREELLRHTERMASIGTTLAGVAHELNNPLAAIIGFSQLLLKRPLATEDREALEAINHEAMRTATVVRNLLAMVRRRGGGRRVAISMNEIIEYVVRTRRYPLETAGIACRLELDPASPLVHGDPAHLEQVMLNLFSNAEQALLPSLDFRQPVPAWIAIRTRHDDTHVIIEVSDNGPGIPEYNAARIWDAFWTTKHDGEGTGLGLSVAHSIILEHGGTIGLAKGDDNGARFVIRLPIATANQQREATEQARRALDVLLVDADPGDAGFVERFLTSRGHAVVNPGSGEAAVTLAAHSCFDAIVCDAAARLRDGRSVAQALAATIAGSRARMVLSASAEADEATFTTLEGGILVTRPYDIEQLRRAVEGD